PRRRRSLTSQLAVERFLPRGRHGIAAQTVQRPCPIPAKFWPAHESRRCGILHVSTQRWPRCGTVWPALGSPGAVHFIEEGNMFAVIRHYHFDAKNGNEIDRQIREGFVPLLKKAKGFVRYYWLDTGDGEGASISVYKDKAGADESVLLAADFVKTNMSELL